MLKDIRLGRSLIGEDHPPFIIAEMSGNHNQSLDRALEIVRHAAKAGAHGLKLQTYTADTMTLDIKDGHFYIDDPKSLWNGHSLYELYQKAHTPWEWHKPIFDLCHELGMVCFSTPFDSTAVDFLEELDNPIYKIASFELTDIPLLKKVASTGMASLSEIEQLVTTLRNNGAGEIVLLKCTSTYPASPENTNIVTIPHLREMFDVHVGLSDHTLGVGVAIASVALGASIIEKHFTLSRSDGGVDSAFSIEPQELKCLVEESKRAFQGLGKITYGCSDVEKKSNIFRRSLFVAEDIAEGEKFNEKNLRVVRPCVGLSPQFYSDFIGRKATKDLKKGTPVTLDLLFQ